jgi:hypothetical protein
VGLVGWISVTGDAASSPWAINQIPVNINQIIKHQPTAKTGNAAFEQRHAVYFTPGG